MANEKFIKAFGWSNVLTLSLGIVSMMTLISGLAKKKSDRDQDLVVRNSMGMQLMVAGENRQPTLRIVLPDHPTSDRAIEVIFPEHVTVRERGSIDAYQLYIKRPTMLPISNQKLKIKITDTTNTSAASSCTHSIRVPN